MIPTTGINLIIEMKPNNKYLNDIINNIYIARLW